MAIELSVLNSPEWISIDAGPLSASLNATKTEIDETKIQMFYPSSVGSPSFTSGTSLLMKGARVPTFVEESPEAVAAMLSKDMGVVLFDAKNGRKHYTAGINASLVERVDPRKVWGLLAIEATVVFYGGAVVDVCENRDTAVDKIVAIKWQKPAPKVA